MLIYGSRNFLNIFTWCMGSIDSYRACIELKINDVGSFALGYNSFYIFSKTAVVK